MVKKKTVSTPAFTGSQGTGKSKKKQVKKRKKPNRGKDVSGKKKENLRVPFITKEKHFQGRVRARRGNSEGNQTTAIVERPFNNLLWKKTSREDAGGVVSRSRFEKGLQE